MFTDSIDFVRLAPRVLALACLTAAARADLNPVWVASLPVGASLSAGLSGMVVDAAGMTYVTGTLGASSNTDVVTAAFRPDGSLLWSHTYDGPVNGSDQGSAVALGPGGVLWVTGNTPGPDNFAHVLLLAYDAAGGSLLHAIQYSSGPSTSEYGGSVAVDTQGGVYVGGGTVGDGADAMVLKFDASGLFLWKRVWDGPAFGPYSQDSAQKILLDPAGEPVVLIHGVMASNHPDYVVVKYAAANGSTIWEANWGVSGEDSPSDMKIDASSDVYVTGTGIDLTNKFSTIKLRGSDGHLLWQAYDSAAFDDRAAALALDGHGGVYVTGRVDPDGDLSNFNDNIYTVKRDAASGAFLWSHLYGANCIGCFDVPADIAVDPAGHVFVAGVTSSPPYSGDVITLVLDAATGAEVTRGIVPGGTNQSASPSFLRFDGAYNVLVGGETYDFNTGEVAISVFKYASLLGSVPPVSYCFGDGTGTACPCGNAGLTGNGCANSLNANGANLAASGTSSISADALVLHGSGMPDSSCLYFQGTTQENGGVGVVFGDGLRCAGGSVIRLGTKPNVAGASQYPSGGDPAVSVSGLVTAPGVRTYQCWYRNAAAFCTASTFNLTNGLSITWTP